MSWPWGTYLGADAIEKGISAKVSTWRRVGANTIPHAAKATGVYINSMLAVMEANRAGYDEAILLTEDGYVADGSGENIFAVKEGVIYTPDLSASILPGITRDSIVQIAQDLGYSVVTKPLIRTDPRLGLVADARPQVVQKVRAAEIGRIGIGTETLALVNGNIGKSLRSEKVDAIVPPPRHQVRV